MIGQQAVNTAKSGPASIVYDPSDGDLWFTEFDADKIGMINPTTKAVTEFNVPTANADPGGIAVDANGNIWFTERSTNKIGELSPDDPNQITEYDVDGEPFGITAGPDANIWITEDTSVWSVDVINPSNGSTIHSYHLVTGVDAIVSKIIVGPDGNLWFNAPDLYGTGISPGYVGSITTAGVITEYPVPDANPEGITAGKDGNIWFTATGSYDSTTGTSYPNVIGVITLSSASIPTQLGVTPEISGSVTAGDGFGLAVSVENSLGNSTIDYNGTVTIALHNNPSHDTLGGTLTATVNNGVAVFSGLTLKDAAQGVTITATAAGLTSITTQPFNVTLGATQLVVTTEPPQPPGSVADGTTFTIVVSAEDGLSNVVTSYEGLVTLTLATNPGDATLGGTLQIGATNGIATFSDLTLNEIGDGYTILAAATGLKSATTAAFDVTEPPATHLVLATPPPGELTAGAGFGLVVDAEDDQGYIDPTYNSTVTVALAGGPTGASLGGTVTLTANRAWPLLRPDPGHRRDRLHASGLQRRSRRGRLQKHPVVQALACSDPNLPGGTVYAFQVDSSADFLTSWQNFDRWWGFDPTSAQNTCPPAGSGGEGTYPFNNNYFPSTDNQVVQCQWVGQKGDKPAYAWAYPTEDAFFLAVGAEGSAISDLDNWWKHDSLPTASPSPSAP